MVTIQDIEQARALLHGIAVRTPLVAAELPIERRFFVKPENLQPIGSFKLRGGYNKISSLTPEERERGVVAHSSGNHAQGVAFAARALGVKATIVMPSNAPKVKLDATRNLGAEIVMVGPASAERIQKAEELEKERHLIPVPPYNDEKIIAGQGTIGLEIMDEMPFPDVVLVPVGGGGLLSGIAVAIKAINSRVKVIGVEPEFVDDATRSFKTGTIQTVDGAQAARTIADGLRSVGLGPINFEHIMKYVDGFITVTEDEIKKAMRQLLFSARILAEPSGAVTTAAAMFHNAELEGSGPVIAVVSGGNVEPKLFMDILQGTI
jgi:threonine dehydratase